MFKIPGRLLLIMLMFGILLVFTGCTPAENNTPQTFHDTLQPYDQEVSQQEIYPVEVQEFDLGAREYLAPYDKIMPYNLKGVIGVPEGSGEFPLILIAHGSHSNDDESKRFDTGYDYLVEKLAEQGFITVALDLSKPFIWKYGENDDREKSIYVTLDHLYQLLAADQGENKGYPVDLENKIDFTRIGLIGHSRGGETSLDIAEEFAQRGYPVEALLSIAPTLNFFDRNWVVGDVAILVPEYDGDVIGFDGYKLFSVLNDENKRRHSVTLLARGNHNYFNRNIERNDARMLGAEIIEDQLSREEQEKFLELFAVDFFQDTLQKGTNNKHRLYSTEETQPNTLYGYDVKVLQSVPDATPLLDLDNLEATVRGEGAEFKRVIDSWFFKDDEIYIDTVTGVEGYDQKPLLHVKWESQEALLTIEPQEQDFSKKQALVMELVPDSASELQKELSHQQFTVRMTDQKGNVASLVLPEQLNALALTPGYLDYTEIFEDTIYYWSRTTPLAAIWIPLSDFQQVDLTQIATVELIFDQVEQGELYIHKVELQ